MIHNEGCTEINVKHVNMHKFQNVFHIYLQKNARITLSLEFEFVDWKSFTTQFIHLNPNCNVFMFSTPK